MSNMGIFGDRRVRLNRDADARVEHVLIQRPLSRVLAFTGRSIDDVVNDPIARNEVLGYFKLHKQIVRSGEILDLEKQWNTP
jgi:hypothetical protein